MPLPQEGHCLNATLAHPAPGSLREQNSLWPLPLFEALNIINEEMPGHDYKICINKLTHCTKKKKRHMCLYGEICQVLKLRPFMVLSPGQ